MFSTFITQFQAKALYHNSFNFSGRVTSVNLLFWNASFPTVVTFGNVILVNWLSENALYHTVVTFGNVILVNLLLENT